jgi:hypothetical protein
MPISYRRSKPNEKPTHEQAHFEVSSNFWDIFIHVPNEQKLNQIIHILKANSHWAFVWTHRILSENYYVLYGYIMFPIRRTQDWFRTNLGNLGNGQYDIAHEHPNTYRLRSIASLSASNRNLFEVAIKIEKESYIAGTGQY